MAVDRMRGAREAIGRVRGDGRRCYALELEPRFVDVAVARWEAFSGETAVRIDE